MPASPSVANKKSPPTQFHDKIEYFNHVANNNNNNSTAAALVPGGVVTTQNISTVIKPKGNENSLQFVKIQTPELSKKAVEQIKLAEDSKISKNKIKEVEEEWQNNLLNWKSKRRQQFPTSTASENERNNSSFESNDGSSGRRYKTFAEMIEQRAKSGNRLSFHLQRYVGDDGYEAEAEAEAEAENEGEEEKAEDVEDEAAKPSPNQEVNDLARKEEEDNNDDDNNDDEGGYQNDEVSETSDLASDEVDDRVCESAHKATPEPSVDNKCEIPLCKTSQDNPPKSPSSSQLHHEKDSTNISSRSDLSSDDSSNEDVQKPIPLTQNNAKAPVLKSVPPPLPLPTRQLESIPPSNVHQNRKTIDMRTSRTNSFIDSPPSQELNRMLDRDDKMLRDVVDSDRSSLSSEKSLPRAVQSIRGNSNLPGQQQQHSQHQSTPNPPPQFSQPPPETPKSTASQKKHLKDHLRDDNEKPYLSVSGKKRCSSCREELGRGAAAFVVESLSLVYHTNCFRCSVCHANLANGFKGVNVRVHAGALHCHNCYSKDGLNYSRV